MTRVRLSEDLTPISDFRVRTAEIVAKIKKTKRPVILTQRGRSATVLEDVHEYERKAERLELLEAVLMGLRAAEKGAVIPHAKAMAELDKVLNA
ncbi:MAG: type II toxin-antitoxin system Phd/YefM family antitoxin [Nitrospirae bacterium]|nr:type II toxin-antitoxin system Phd/YefM family antitoxin [Nitrospirota bacterium]